MERYFVDTSFLVSRFNHRDANHAAAIGFLQSRSTRPMRWIISDYVFDETVTTVLATTRRRDLAEEVGETILRSPIVQMDRIDEALFDDAWDLFRRRKDKFWSFTDCSSFALMRRRGIPRALTFDGNFAESGFEMVP